MNNTVFVNTLEAPCTEITVIIILMTLTTIRELYHGLTKSEEVLQLLPEQGCELHVGMH